jgi:TolB-like protein/Tfp pilus assembly protein PilF
MGEPPASTLLSRLKQRKVVRWAAAYLGSMWLTLQVLGFFSQTFAWPPLILRSIAVVLGAGFLAVLILAWYHGEKGRQRVGGVELALLAATVGLAGAGVAWVARPTGAIPGGTAAADLPAAAAAQESLAVLPFADLSPERDQEYFSDGLAEELLHALARLPGLRVAARTSSFSFKGQNVAVDSVARALRVTHVLEGSVRSAGGRIRVSTNLVNAATGYRLWSETYDRELTDIFRIQDEIARAIVVALQLQLSPGQAGPLVLEETSDPEALKLYLRGRHAWNRRMLPSIRAAIEYFQQAVERDPGYARGWAGLADAFAIMPAYEGGSPSDWFGKAEAAALRAITLDSTLAEPHAALGFVYTQTGRIMAAEREFRLALKLNPGHATTYQWYGMHLGRTGQAEEALRASRRAHELDPLSPVLALNTAIDLYHTHRIEEAIETFRRLIEVEATFGVAHAHLARALAFRGDMEEAGAAAARALQILGFQTHGRALTSAGYALARAGEHEQARAILTELERRVDSGSINPGGYGPAAIHVALGEYDQALDWVARAAEQQHFYPLSFPEFDPL